jgi:Tfp pilus assembly protein PilO
LENEDKKSEFFLDLDKQREKLLEHTNAKKNIQAVNFRQLTKIKEHLKKEIKNMLNQVLQE